MKSQEPAPTDAKALEIARLLGEATGASQSILFGSRARGDHRPNSDIDVLLLVERPPEDQDATRLALRKQVEKIRQETLPEACGVDFGWMTPDEYITKRQYVNSLAEEVQRDGVIAMAERANYVNDHDFDGDADLECPSVDWEQAMERRQEAFDCITDIERDLRYAELLNGGEIDRSDRNFAEVLAKAVECSYKAALESHGIKYDVQGGRGHSLTSLVEKMRDGFGSPVPGESCIDLQNHSGGRWYGGSNRNLDQPGLAREAPAIARAILAMMAQPADEQ